MADTDADDPVIANPTYLADIRNFFRQVDIDHMRAKNIDIGTYAGVKANAQRIYFATAPPSPSMPPASSGPPWSANRSQTFRNWIANGCPIGTATPPQPTDYPPPDTGGGPSTARVRKNVASLTPEEVETLKKAFAGVMARDSDPKNKESYLVIAGYHGLPGQFCQHHADGYNPWHRAYLKVFEDQLRTIPGCENVTLPYWDVTTLLLDVLQEAPLASYKLPRDPGDGTPFPYTTSRYDPATIQSNMEGMGVYQEIETSKTQSVWGVYNTNGYQLYSIQAHDGGHLSTGDTMANQDVAAYDPVFWFYHCNLDRLWLNWQIAVGGTTLAGFESTIVNDPPGKTFLEPGFNSLPPFATTSDETITFDITYDDDGLELAPAPVSNAVGSIEAASSFSINSSAPVSVRVKDIDRLNIPGSFIVKLMSEGEAIAKRGFFQPTQPRKCAACAKSGKVNIDFLLDQKTLADKTIYVEIEVPGHAEIGAKFPLSEAGNPTINARLLLNDE